MLEELDRRGRSAHIQRPRRQPLEGGKTRPTDGVPRQRGEAKPAKRKPEADHT